MPGFFLIVSMILFTSPAAGESMKVGRQTSQPIGHYEFCQIYPTECRIRSSDQGLLQLTDQLWDLIVEVNSTVNSAITAKSDDEIYGVDEFWTYPKDVGDCEDYVLEKRKQLHQQGISLANLLITVVRKPDNEGHAVLTVRTDQGDFILDNLETTVMPWRDTEYKYLKRQASYHTGKWVDLLKGDNNERLVTASP